MDKVICESLIIGVDFSTTEDTGVVIVGRQRNGVVDVVNAFQGEEAWALYQKLVTVKEGKKHQ